jgi:hypothetical protein
LHYVTFDTFVKTVFRKLPERYGQVLRSTHFQ